MNCAGGEVVVADQHERPAAVPQARPEGHALDVVERDAEIVEVQEQPLVGRVPRSDTSKSLIVLPVSGAPTENDRSIAIRRSSSSGSSSTSPLTENWVAGTGGSATGVGVVEPLALDPALAQVVAEDPRAAPVGHRRGGAVLEERVLRRDEEVVAVGGGALEAEVLPHALRRIRRHQELRRHRQRAEEAPAQRVPPHERVDPGVPDALRGEDQLAVLGQRRGLRDRGCSRDTGCRRAPASS